MESNSTDQFCLHCGTRVSGKFCSECGQSSETKRFQFNQILTQDFLKRAFYFDKGLFYSIKELYTRPGHSVREYIQGKRALHLNYFSLLIILIFIFKMIENLTPFRYSDLVSTDKEQVDFFEEEVKHYAKLFFISLIPLYALVTFLIFKKARLNYAEHFVINTFRSAALLLLTILFLMLASIIKDVSVVVIINRLITVIMLGYGTWFYYQYFSIYYSNKFGLLTRSILSVLVPFTILVIALSFYLSFHFK
jgi:hypothetical protein